MSRWSRSLLRVSCLAGAAVACAWVFWSVYGGVNALPAGTRESVALAVLGDSDSHSYHDREAFPPGTGERGGAYRATTFQWTEALARLRGDQLDPGRWDVHGALGVVAHATQALGLGGRSPRKEDYEYNFAVSGDGCDALLGGSSRQVPSLLSLMDEAPARWRNGVVVIRIGVNTFGTAETLDALAQDPQAPMALEKIAACVVAIRESVVALHARHPGVRIVLVGIFDNAHWAKYLHKWQSPESLENINQGLDRFDDALRAMALADSRLAFFDDRAWFHGLWGARDEKGIAAYREIKLGGMRISNSLGDAPVHSTLADGHAGTAWNALWAQSLVALLNQQFDLGIAPIRDEEVLALVKGRKLPAAKAPGQEAGQKLDRPVASVKR